MKVRVIRHFSKETGKFLGEEIQTKPFWFWPGWHTVQKEKKYFDSEELNSDVLFLFSLSGLLKYSYEYN